jgi:hypothetical protein
MIYLLSEVACLTFHLKCRLRRLDAAGQALLVLAYLRCGDTLEQLTAGFELSAMPLKVPDGTIIATQTVTPLTR